jgi:hypothetical protein
MKLRLKDNSIRLRLSQRDVDNLAAKGSVEEQLKFSKDTALFYRLIAKEDVQSLTVSYAENAINIYIPKDFVNGWPKNNVVGTSAQHRTADGTEIFILIEKDFKCLDNIEEDQSDNYANPKLMQQ